jgi:hypothetical protein
MKWRIGNKRLWVVIVSFLPLLLGTYAYLNIYRVSSGRMDVLSALYSAVKLYAAGGDISVDTLLKLRAFENGALYLPTRICLEAGRWLGLFVAASYILSLFYQTIRALRIRVKAGAENAIALHGQESYTRLLAESIGKNAVVTDSDDKFAARRHIVTFGDDSTLYRYLGDHFRQFTRPTKRAAERQVFVCAVNTPRTNYQTSGFVISNMAENCARMYWRELYLRHFGDHSETRIVLLGFGAYGQELLKQALLVNVFIRHEPPVRYDVFGDWALFMTAYGGIANFTSVNEESRDRDSVLFHTGRFENELELLRKADRIIVALDSEEDNLQALRQLVALELRRPIHLRASGVELVRCLWPTLNISEQNDGAELCVFGTDRSLYQKSIIMDEQLLYTAQCIHARYMARAGNKACAHCKRAKSPDTCVKDCADFSEEWKKLSPFYQYSNIAQADHIPVKVRELLECNCPASTDTVEKSARRFAELERDEKLLPYLKLEHNRWMRNQYLRDWVYGPVRDNAEKIHPLLVPFEELPQEQKSKDRDAYETLFNLYENNMVK